MLKIALPPAETEDAKKAYADMARELPSIPAPTSEAEDPWLNTLREYARDRREFRRPFPRRPCLSCNVDADWVIELVEHGVVEPVGVDRTQWRFASISVVRVAKAKRLQRDLSINPPGVALALDLLDQIDDLRARLRLLQSTTPDKIAELDETSLLRRALA